MSKSVFCLVSSKTCPHCVEFRKIWPDIKNELSNHVRIVDIDLEPGQRSLDPKYPKDLWNLVKHFPTFIMIDPDVWDDNDPKNPTSTKSVPFTGKVFDGNIRPTKESLLAWTLANKKSGSIKKPETQVNPKDIKLVGGGTNEIIKKQNDDKKLVSSFYGKPYYIISKN